MSQNLKIVKHQALQRLLGEGTLGKALILKKIRQGMVSAPNQAG